jgi:hypothetical protein
MQQTLNTTLLGNTNKTVSRVKVKSISLASFVMQVWFATRENSKDPREVSYGK